MWVSNKEVLEQFRAHYTQCAAVSPQQGLLDSLYQAQSRYLYSWSCWVGWSKEQMYASEIYIGKQTCTICYLLNTKCNAIPLRIAPSDDKILNKDIAKSWELLCSHSCLQNRFYISISFKLIIVTCVSTLIFFWIFSVWTNGSSDNEKYK